MEELTLPHEDRESLVRHRYERDRQILLPVVIVALLMLVVAGFVLLAYFAENPELNKWAATAGIILLAITIALMLILLIVLVALIAGTTIALQKTPRYTGIFGEYFLHYSALSRRYMDMAMAPLIAIESWLKVPGDLRRRRKRKDT